jgi:DNA-binding XRE family transcriptional regulator
MDRWEFLRWRRTLGYTQEEAGAKLGVTRGTIQHWERGMTRIPLAIELACRELTRRWKQCPEFGPVSLVYADTRVSSRVRTLHCELHSNNESAFVQVLLLSATPTFINPFIMEDDGDVIWTTAEIRLECERRTREQRGSGEQQPIPIRAAFDDG